MRWLQRVREISAGCCVSGRIQLGNVLAPGEYVAQVVVTDLLADIKHQMATQWIDFEIVK
jgi:hypothetical protein